MKTIKQLLNKYVVRPLRLVISNGSILFLILAILLLDHLMNDTGIEVGSVKNIDQLLNGNWAYEQLPSVFINLGGAGSIFAGLVTPILFFFQSFLTVVTMLDLKLIYQNSRKGIFHTFQQIPMKDVFWFFLWITLVYVVFSVIALIFYLPSLWLWNTYKINTVIPLFAIAAFLFPAFYSMLSIGGKISIIQMSWKEKFLKVAHGLKLSSLLKIYAFYPIRLGIEFACVVIAPAITLILFNNRFIALVAGIVALLVPMAIFRASTFEFFLELYRDDPLIQQNFIEHFKANKKVP